MLKVDEPVVREFLGTTEGVIGNISPFKCCRFYLKDGEDMMNPQNYMLILTPTMREDGNVLKNIVDNLAERGYKITATEHKRGKNYAYTFSKIEE